MNDAQKRFFHFSAGGTAAGLVFLTGIMLGESKGYHEGIADGKHTERLAAATVCQGVYSTLAENSRGAVNTEFADDRVFVLKMAMALSEGNPMRDVYLARSEQIRQDAEAALYLQQTAATLASDTCRKSLENLANR